MTHFNTASTADNQQSWSKVLRITEVAAGLPPSTHPHPARAAFDALQAAFTKLQHAWQWVERKRTLQLAAKRLRVAETVSLGEKRTISIITVDGSHYLIGSSAGGVQLLTRLDQAVENATPNERPS